MNAKQRYNNTVSKKLLAFCTKCKYSYSSNRLTIALSSATSPSFILSSSFLLFWWNPITIAPIEPTAYASLETTILCIVVSGASQHFLQTCAIDSTVVLSCNTMQHLRLLGHKYPCFLSQIL